MIHLRTGVLVFYIIMFIWTIYGVNVFFTCTLFVFKICRKNNAFHFWCSAMKAWSSRKEYAMYEKKNKMVVPVFHSGTCQ